MTVHSESEAQGLRPLEATEPPSARPLHLRAVRLASWLALLTQLSYFAANDFPEWYKVVAFVGAVVCVASLVAVLVLRQRRVKAPGIIWSLKPALWGSPIGLLVVGVTLLSVLGVSFFRLLSRLTGDRLPS